jgi:hypothetical protein
MHDHLQQKGNPVNLNDLHFLTERALLWYIVTQLTNRKRVMIYSH